MCGYIGMAVALLVAVIASLYGHASFNGAPNTLYAVMSATNCFEVDLLDVRTEVEQGRVTRKDLVEWKRYIRVMNVSYAILRTDQHKGYRTTLPDGENLKINGWKDSDQNVLGYLWYAHNVSNATREAFGKNFTGISDYVASLPTRFSNAVTAVRAAKQDFGVRSDSGVLTQRDQNDDVTLASNPKTSEGYLIFKGTSTKNGFVTDFKILLGNVGIVLGKVFGDNVRQMTSVYAQLAADQILEDKVKTLVVTGHSLGGFRAGFVGTSDVVVEAIWRNNGGKGDRMSDEAKAETISKYISLIIYDPVGWDKYYSYSPAVRAALKSKLRIVSYGITAVSSPIGGKMSGPMYLADPRHKSRALGWAEAGDFLAKKTKNKELGLWWKGVVDTTLHRFLDEKSPDSEKGRPVPSQKHDAEIDVVYPPVRELNNWTHQHETIRAGIEGTIDWADKNVKGF